VFDITWIVSITPERLVIVHRAGRLLRNILLLGGSVFAFFAITETDSTRWLAAIMLAVVLCLVWIQSFEVTVLFDRPANAVFREERRPFWTDRASMALDEVSGVTMWRRSGKTRLGLATRAGEFFPIEAALVRQDKSEIIAAIEAWLADDGPAA
jgi:hypothetical protein